MLLLAFLSNSCAIYPSQSGGATAPPAPMVVTPLNTSSEQLTLLVYHLQLPHVLYSWESIRGSQPVEQQDVQ